MNELLLKLMSLGALIIIAFSVIYIILNIFKISNPFKKIFSTYKLEALFFVSLAATVGSLLLSFYFKLEACELCWYQRVFLFPIPFITAIALIKKDIKASVYVYWLALVGLLFATYHSLLQSKLFLADTVFCNPSSVIDCAIPVFTYFGFVTVPIISFSVFILLVTIAYESK